jgi:hypothetical protein
LVVGLAVVPVIDAAVVGAIVGLDGEDPLLPGIGSPLLPGERVTGALLGKGGRRRSALTMRSPNCSTVVSRPRVLMGSANACVGRAGC